MIISETMTARLRPKGLFCTAAGIAALAMLTHGTPAHAADDSGSSAHIRGLVVPLQHARLSSRLQATIDRIGPENGEAFKAGDALVEFDCTSYTGERARVAAEAEAAAASLAVKRELANSGAASRLQVQLAAAELKRTQAQVNVADKQVADCVIRAPLETTTNCPPTADRGADCVPVPPALWRDHRHSTALCLSRR